MEQHIQNQMRRIQKMPRYLQTRYVRGVLGKIRAEGIDPDDKPAVEAMLTRVVLPSFCIAVYRQLYLNAEVSK